MYICFPLQLHLVSIYRHRLDVSCLEYLDVPGLGAVWLHWEVKQLRHQQDLEEDVVKVSAGC